MGWSVRNLTERRATPRVACVTLRAKPIDPADPGSAPRTISAFIRLLPQDASYSSAVVVGVLHPDTHRLAECKLGQSLVVRLPSG